MGSDLQNQQTIPNGPAMMDLTTVLIPTESRDGMQTLVVFHSQGPC